MPGVSNLVLLDPAELAERFAPANDEDDDVRRSRLTADILGPLLERIPKWEREIVHMYFRKGKSQREIAEFYDCTQAAISYRLARALARMRFLAELPRVTEEQMRDDLSEVFEDVDVNVLVALWRHSGQSAVALELGLSQTNVRDRFYRCLDRLEKVAAKDERFEPYKKLFDAIVKTGWNILREVRMPFRPKRAGK